MAESLLRINFHIDTKQKARLDKLNELTDVPVAAMIRRAIDAYLDEKEATLRKKK